jgi:hypothetical protein
MRKRLNSILGFLFAGLILSSMAPHCLFEDDDFGAVQVSAADSHPGAQAHDHDGKGSDDDCCIARADLEAGQLPRVAASSPPQIKHIIDWPIFCQASFLPLADISHLPFLGPNPRASRGRFLSAKRTGRLLI